MGLSRLRAFLKGRKAIAVDSSVFIYQLEKNSHYFSLTDEIFAFLEGAGRVAITSTLTLTEVTVPTYMGTDKRTPTLMQGLLSTYPGFVWVPPSMEIAAEAARLRADYKFKTPDAIHAATAIVEGVRGFITNDIVFRRMGELETLILNDLL